jgi:signal transduction histidine kinase
MSNAGGKGFGLAICQKIIESHQGRIWVEPNENKKGSKFVIIVPNNLPIKNFYTGR